MNSINSNQKLKHLSFKSAINHCISKINLNGDNQLCLGHGINFSLNIPEFQVHLVQYYQLNHNKITLILSGKLKINVIGDYL